MNTDLDVTCYLNAKPCTIQAQAGCCTKRANRLPAIGFAFRRGGRVQSSGFAGFVQIDKNRLFTFLAFLAFVTGHGGRLYYFYDLPYRAGINPAPTIISCYRSHSRLARLGVPLCLAPCALCLFLHAPCSMLHAANGVSHNGQLTTDHGRCCKILLHEDLD